MDVCLVRPGGQAAAKVRDRFVDGAVFGEGIADVVIRLGHVRVNGECLAVRFERPAGLAGFLEKDAEGVMRVGIIRPAANGAFDGGDGFIRSPKVGERQAEVEQTAVVVRVFS